MITKKLKYAQFDWDGKNMGVAIFPKGGPLGTTVIIPRVYLLSLMRFGLRVLTRKHDHKKV